MVFARLHDHAVRVARYVADLIVRIVIDGVGKIPLPRVLQNIRYADDRPQAPLIMMFIPMNIPEAPDKNNRNN